MAVGLPLLLSTCRQVAGIDDRAVDPLACGVAFPTDCQSCVAQQCCGEALDCAASPGCASLQSCLANCAGEPACRSQCSADNPVTNDLASAKLEACLAGQCESACGLSCGALHRLTGPTSAARCQSCLSRNHCEATRACGKSVDCQLYLGCRTSCVTGDCVGSCPALGSAGVDYCYGECGNTYCVRPCSSDFDDVLQLSTGLYEAVAAPDCQRECGWGRNWSCVGDLVAPRAQSVIRNLAVALNAGRNASGITVKMCRTSDQECAQAVSQSTTDAHGLVHLVDSTTSENGAGYGLNGYLDATSDRLYQTRVYWGFHLSERNGAFAIPIPIFDLATLTGLFPQLDPSVGLVAVTVVDCLGIQAPDVVVTLIDKDGQSHPAYYVNGLPTLTASTTNETGTAFFINVAPGDVTLSAKPVGLDHDSTNIIVPVRAGLLTGVNLEPSE